MVGLAGAKKDAVASAKLLVAVLEMSDIRPEAGDYWQAGRMILRRLEAETELAEARND